MLPAQRPPINQGIVGLDWNQFTVVRLSHSVRHPPVSMVTHDHVGNTMLAFRTMREIGYQRIGFVADETNTAYGFFDVGFMKAQQAVPARQRLPLLMIPGESSSEARTEMVDTWVRRHRPDAILTTDASILRALETGRHRVPDDVGLASTSADPAQPVAGILENPTEVGRLAVNALVALLEHHELGIPEHPCETLVPGRWVDGPTLPDRRST